MEVEGSGLHPGVVCVARIVDIAAIDNLVELGWGGIGWDVIGGVGIGRDGMGYGVGWDGVGWKQSAVRDGVEWDGMGWDGVGWGGTKWDRMAALCRSAKKRLSSFSSKARASDWSCRKWARAQQVGPSTVES